MGTPFLSPPILLEVYIDEQKKSYQDLGYKRFNWISIWKALLSAVSRKALREVSYGCLYFRGWYVQASMELGPKDVSLLEVSSFQRVVCTELGPEDSFHYPHLLGS